MSELDLPRGAGRLFDAAPETGGAARPSRVALAAAALLHGVIAALLLFHWQSAPVPAQPDLVPVTLVIVPPPRPKPAPPAPTPPKALAERESGPGERTTAPPPAEAPAPEIAAPAPPEAPPAPPQPPQQSSEKPSPLPPPGEPEKPRKVARAETPARKEAPARTAPKPETQLTDRTIGETAETGDPYLNKLYALIERNRRKTTPIGASGLHLEGTSVYVMMIRRDGKIVDLRLVRSSGAVLLDEEAKRMIVAAAPLPPSPTEFPDPVDITVEIHLYPQ